VLAKKKSVGATHLIIDIPFGPGAKIETEQEAKHLKQSFLVMTRRLGIKTKVLITDGSQPIGRGIGPLLETEDILKVLRNDADAPLDLREKSLLMAGELLNLSGKTKDGFMVAQHLLDSGKAYEKFMDIIEAQGRKRMLPLATHKHTFTAWKTGIVKSLDNRSIGKMALLCGAPQTKQAGAYLHKKTGEHVRKGQPLMTLYANNKTSLEYASRFFKKHVTYVIR
jgi:thymidine phosphorylase